VTQGKCSPIGFENLLLATDGSQSAAPAIQEAMSMAKTCSSRLIVLSVVEVNPEYEALAPELVDKAGDETKAHLDSVRKRAVSDGVPCEIISHQGQEPYRFIVEEAAGRNVDMIIMGSHGRTGLRRLLMGSVTARVIGHAPCKVMVVPSGDTRASR
jgi:nucleotide-binding universal stress UspA family protein